MDEQNTQTTPKSSTAKIAVIVVVIVLLIIVSIVGFQMISSNNQTKMVNNTQIKSDAMMMSNENSMYKDGTYEMIGDYVSPGGPETIEVTVTLTEGKITDATVVPQATRPISKIKQADFAANYKPMVIGKSIDEVMLTKVSGSSLTPKGFNDALEKIKVEAKS